MISDKSIFEGSHHHIFFTDPELMAAERTSQAAHFIDGISLASFLQLLEHERKACTLVVNEGDNTGYLYFNDGSLIDAELSDTIGLEAAYIILSWKKPVFHLAAPKERIVRITQPLGRLLLTASTQRDESEAGSNMDSKPVTPAAPAMNKGLARVVEKLAGISGVRHYYLLNKQGKPIAGSTKNSKIADFIAYCTVNGMQMRDAFGAKGLHNIRIRMPDDDILLIVPAKSITIGLILTQGTSMNDVFTGLRQALSPK